MEIRITDIQEVILFHTYEFFLSHPQADTLKEEVLLQTCVHLAPRAFNIAALEEAKFNRYLLECMPLDYEEDTDTLITISLPGIALVEEKLKNSESLLHQYAQSFFAEAQSQPEEPETLDFQEPSAPLKEETVNEVISSKSETSTETASEKPSEKQELTPELDQTKSTSLSSNNNQPDPSTQKQNSITKDSSRAQEDLRVFSNHANFVDDLRQKDALDNQADLITFNSDSPTTADDLLPPSHYKQAKIAEINQQFLQEEKEAPLSPPLESVEAKSFSIQTEEKADSADEYDFLNSIYESR